MKIAMDRTGRVVIPRIVRERAQLRPGVPLEIRVRNGVVEIEPASSAVTLEQRGRWTVAVSSVEDATLTQEDVDAVLEEVRSGGRG